MCIRKLKGAVLGMTALALTLVSGTAFADWALNMPKGATAVSHEVYDLHMTIFYVCVAIAVVVFGAMIVSIILHRKSRGVEPAKFHHNTVVEIVWTIIPFFILVAMAVPAAKVLLTMDDYRNSDMSIKVTGYQWKWHYDYLNQGVSFFGTLDDKSNAARMLDSGIDPSSVKDYLLNVDHPLVVPVGKKVHLLLTSGDVIHSWWVPALGGKKDAIPGYVNEWWFKVDKPGTFRGQCAELCGRGHAFMPIVVKAVSADDYAAWVKAHGGHLPSEAGENAQAATQSGSQSADLKAAR